MPGHDTPTSAAVTPSDQPRVLAIEGLCFAGKTTLATRLGRRADITVVAEYSTLAPLPTWPPTSTDDVRAALVHFRRIEEDRARTARRSGRPLVIMDRSPLTLIAHEYGMAQLGIPALPALAAHLFADAVDDGRILVPDGYLHLAIPSHITATRQAHRGPVPPHLTDPRTQAGITAATHSYLAAIPTRRRLCLDGTASLDALTAQVNQFTTALPNSGRQPPPSWRLLANPANVHLPSAQTTVGST